MMNKQKLLITPLLALLVSGSAFADGGYVKDSWGNIVVNPYGECWRTMDYVASDAANCPSNKAAIMAKQKKAQMEADRLAQIEADRLARIAAEKKAMMDAQMAADRKAKMEADRKAKMAAANRTPAPAPAPVVKQVINLEGVNFETSSNKLTGGSLNTLDSVAQELKANPGIKIVVEGHTDSRGDASFNQMLSQKRAEAVRDQLISQGISANSISAKGFGENRAIATNDTSTGRAKNRRVELRILK